MSRLSIFLAALLLLAGLAAVEPATAREGEDPEDPETDDPSADGQDEPDDPEDPEDAEDPSGSDSGSDDEADAQDDDSSGSGSAGSGNDTQADRRAADEARECLADADTDEERAECRADLCEERPQHRLCRSYQPDPRRQDSEICRADNDTREGRSNCATVRDFRDDEPEFIHFTLNSDGSLSDYRVGDLLVFESLRFDAAGQPVLIKRHGPELRAESDDAELRLHDNPVGLIHFKGEEGSIVLVLPDGTEVQQGGQGFRLEFPGGEEALLVADNATINGTVLVLSEFFSFHVPARESLRLHDDLPAPDAHDLDVEEAIEDQQVGARVTLRHVPGQVAASAEEQPIQVEAYADVDVEVDLPEEVTNATPIRVVVSSEQEEGKTIVLDVDPALLASTDEDSMLLRYFDLNEDGSETEVIFRVASSLQDILDPSDDGGQPEYWIVTDANGVQVMVSVPHWSAHAITMASVVEFVSSPSVLVGVVAGTAGSIVAAVLMLWPRRRDDDE